MRPATTLSVCVEVADCDHPEHVSPYVGAFKDFGHTNINSINAARLCSLPKSFSGERVLLIQARAIQLSLDPTQEVSNESQDAEAPPAGLADNLLWAVFVPPALIEPAIRDLVRGARKGAAQADNEDDQTVHGTRTHQDMGMSLVADEIGNKKNEDALSQSNLLQHDRCTGWILDNANDINGLLSQIHPSLSSFSIRGIITRVRGKQLKRLVDYDMIFMAPHNGIEQTALSALESIQGEGMIVAPHAVIKALPISQVMFVQVPLSPPTIPVSSDGKNALKLVISGNLSMSDGFSAIPSCPTCIHRIEPQRLGMPKPRNHQLCSHFCATEGKANHRCSIMKFLTSWPHPSHCEACEVISKHLRSNTRLGAVTPSTGSSGAPASASFVEGATLPPKDDADIVYCTKCKMKETLWVCLTCGVVGCGRYSHGHAEEHYNETRHPYSLELATQRIWDYATGGFAHRGDFLVCPLMQHRLGKGSTVDSTEGGQTSTAASDAPSKDSVGLHNQSSFDSFDAPSSYMNSTMTTATALSPDDPSPKKASMIGEEYEALLQSALEDQAQHYEFEITRLIAELTGKGVDEEKISEKETAEIEMLQKQISELHMEVDRLSHDLLDKQAQEAGDRATYQRLLREQAIAKELLEKISEESEREKAEGDTKVAELEQQVMDLTANLRMREQIALDEDIFGAQIFGTSGFAKASKPKRGKKSRRPRK